MITQSQVSIRIRIASQEDLPAITRIYNEAILHTTATFDVTPKTLKEQTQWWKAHGERHPILVAEAGGVVVGWASLSQYSDRCAYDDIAETSFYVTEEWRGKGIGKGLLTHLIQEARQLKFHSLMARMSEESEVSLNVHESLGFERVGILKESGFKFGRRLDVIFLQRMMHHG